MSADNLCPECGGEAVRQCRCPRGDSQCAKGHEWHTCVPHRVKVKGPSDHGTPTFNCTCGKGDAKPATADGRYLLDATGREIKVGDVLKVFHFFGSRGKKFYMYKWVMRRDDHPHGSFLTLSHLHAKDVAISYTLKADGRLLTDVQIVQGFETLDHGDKTETISFEDRPRRKPLTGEVTHNHGALPWVVAGARK